MSSLTNELMAMTTIIETVVKNKVRFQSSGFFYTEQGPVESGKTGAQWYNLERYWLVTNRHVVLPQIDGIEYVPDEMKFCFREIDNGNVNWLPIVLSQKEIVDNLKLHPQGDVDVALIDITSYVEMVTKNCDPLKVVLPTELSNLVLPENQPILIEVTSDIVIASYPMGFYDEVNKFPIVKSGIIASAWGHNFKGQPVFQIDAQLFHGSSGGVVISKPTDIAMIDGNLKVCNSKQYALLGIYSGEYLCSDIIEIDGKEHTSKHSYGLGNVWYSYLIPDIIENGVRYTYNEKTEIHKFNEGKQKILQMLKNFLKV